MAIIMGIVQIKGGCGRSTIATNLAGSLVKAGRVALIDGDMPQATSASWAAIRRGGMTVPDVTIATAISHIEMVEQIKRLSEDNDYIVIDGPPRIAEMTRVMLVISDLCLIPLGASAAEIWATSDLLPTINEAKAVKPAVDARILWTRFRGNTNSAKELSTAAQEELGLKELQSKIGYRVAYSEALARGLTVLEWHERTARLEFQEVCKEIKRILKEKR